MATSSGDAENQQTLYHFNGVKVYSPVKLYPSQKMMITKTIGSIESCQHCLLESPTGSGKTLALLCGALAWQQNEYDLLAKETLNVARDNATQSKQNTVPSLPESPARVPNSLHSQISQVTPSRSPSLLDVSGNVYPPLFGTLEGDEDFKPLKRIRLNSPEILTPPPPLDPALNKASTIDLSGDIEQIPKIDDVKGPQPPPKIRKVPKIYYGTRTHKQITQIVGQLKKTAYKDVRVLSRDGNRLTSNFSHFTGKAFLLEVKTESANAMTILGSREHYCIHKDAKLAANKNDFCRELRTAQPKAQQFIPDTNEEIVEQEEKPMCTFYIGIQKSKNDFVRGLKSPWDIEDLKSAGYHNRPKYCPYYAAKHLKEVADIIFCPYQYLIDPMIRDSMGVNLNNQIIILDEAHNIEDVAREAASLTLTDSEIQNAKTDLEKIAKYLKDYGNDDDKVLAHSQLASLFSKLHVWLLKKFKFSFNDNDRIITGVDLVSEFTELGLGPDTLPVWKHHLQIISEEEESKYGAQLMTTYKVSSKTSKVMDNLFLVLEYLYGRNLINAEDYRICFKKVQEKTNTKENRRRTVETLDWVASVNFWCLNSAIVFQDIGNSVRSIILTSGTLSPMDSFESELSIKFPIKLEAPHVISPSQVWVSTIGSGPNNIKLNASFKSTGTFDFQDEIGLALLDVCKIVSFGVLCVFPSYTLLNKLSERWQCTDLWSQLERYKVIVTEPRVSRDLKQCMEEYFYGVNNWESNFRNGALLMAVCRGKISEGIDFADNYARAVVTIGIPFPNFKDSQVQLKREYNDKFSKQRSLISGSRWYEIQAFRALNQALGRCVRHSKDWGAVILIDERFTTDRRHINNLSKWVRQHVQQNNDFNSAMSLLKNFISERTSDHESTNAVEELSTSSISNYSSINLSQDIYEVKQENDNFGSVKNNFTSYSTIKSSYGKKLPPKNINYEDEIILD